jgi:prophage regulatory protein
MKDVDRLIRLKELIKIIGLGRSTVYKLLNEGKFPKRIKLTQRTVVWRLSEIEAWIEEKDGKN